MVAASTVLACADLEQAATGDGTGSDESSSGSGPDDASASSSRPGVDDTHGTGAGATSGLDADASKTGSEGGDTLAPDDATVGDPTGGPGTSDDGVPPLPGPHDGRYGGTVSVEFSVAGYTGSCQGPLNLVVDELAAPQIAGGGSCSAQVGPYPIDVMMSVDGSIASPDASGTLSAVINFEAEGAPWSGTFADDSLTATFAGTFSQFGYDVAYQGSWNVSR